jgi:predicted Zn finger-like uncharacterized protein
MALATRCPYCNTIFRVASDQLKLRGGIVRCGACHQVFDGNAALLDPTAALQPGAGLPALPVDLGKSLAAAPAPHDLDQHRAIIAQPDATPAPAADAAAGRCLDPVHHPLNHPEFDLDFDLDAELASKSLAKGGHWIDFDAPHARDDAAVMHDPILADPVDPPRAQTDLFANAAQEPGFITQGRRKQSSPAMRRLLVLATGLALLALLGQGTYTLRSELAARLPELKPALSALCVRLGCSIALPARIASITIELGQLQALGSNRFALATLLRNQDSSAQAWPHIELILDDSTEQTVLRRVFTPRDYLSESADPDRGFAARSEQAVKLYFELAQISASGYHIAVFYP